MLLFIASINIDGDNAWKVGCCYKTEIKSAVSTSSGIDQAVMVRTESWYSAAAPSLPLTQSFTLNVPNPACSSSIIVYNILAITLFSSSFFYVLLNQEIRIKINQILWFGLHNAGQQFTQWSEYRKINNCKPCNPGCADCDSPFHFNYLRLSFQTFFLMVSNKSKMYARILFSVYLSVNKCVRRHL